MFLGCDCQTKGTFDNSKKCNSNGECKCRENYAGKKCNRCNSTSYAYAYDLDGGFPLCKGIS